jgi:hypothetical protein
MTVLGDLAADVLIWSAEHAEHVGTADDALGVDDGQAADPAPWKHAGHLPV